MAQARSTVALGAAAQGLVLVAGLLVLVTSLLAAVLGALGWWRPWLVVPLLLLAAVVLARRVGRMPLAPLPAAPVAALLVVCAAAGAWLSATFSSQVLPRRDSGSNLQAAIALADTGRRILRVPAASIGGPGVLDLPGVTLASPAFYEVGSATHPAVQPQFVIGPAAVYSLGRWFGGTGTIWWQAPWLTAVGLLAIGLIAALVIGPWWGSLAAAGVAITFPIVHTGRSTYSEPLAMVTLGAGLLALVLAARADQRVMVERHTALVSGLLVGGTALVRIDGLRETILLIPVAALAAVRGARWPRPALTGAAVGTVVALAAGWALSYRYLGDIAASLVPLAALGVAFTVASVGVVSAGRRGIALPEPLRRGLPWAVRVGVVALGLLLTARPWFMTVRQSATDPGARVVAGLQARQGLTVDGGRTYAEHTVTWLSWWLGPLALAIALLSLAALGGRLAHAWRDQRPLPAWSAPLVVALGSTLLTLWRPGITPDHPWAERRLLIAIPLIVVACVAAAAWASRRESGVGRALEAAIVASTLVAAAQATWPHLGERVERGESTAVASVCRSLHPGDVVLAVDSRAANEWPQVIRGMCAHPALSTTGALRGDRVALAGAVARIAAGLPAGGRLVLLAADSPEAFTGLGGAAYDLATDVTVREDDRLLERRPDHLVDLPIRVWLQPVERP